MSITVGQTLFDDLSNDGVECYLDDVLQEEPFWAPTNSTLKFVVLNGGEFSFVKTLNTITFADILFTLSEASTVATYEIESIAYDYLEYDGIFYGPPQKVLNFKVTQAFINTLASSNLVMKFDGDEVTDQQEIYAGDTVWLEVTNQNFVIDYAYFLDPVSFTQLDFIVEQDGRSASLEFTGSIVFNANSFYFNTEIDAPVDVKGSARVFAVADDDLEAFTQSRFTLPVGDGVFDYGQFILGFIKLPFEIDPQFIIGSDPVHLGPASTGISADVISVDRLVYPLGEIEVPATEGNALDFNGVECLLHLPYANPVSVDPRYVVGETLTVELSINLYDGTGDFVLSSSKLGGVFETVAVALDIAIPFANVTGGIPSKNSPSNISVGVDNSIRTAFVEVVKYPIHNAQGFFTAVVEDDGTLAGHSGYVEVNAMALDVEATSSELETLEEVLRGGVVI